MRKINTLIFICFVSSVISQDINPSEVTVIEGFNPQIPEFEKFKEVTDFLDTTKINKTQEYNFVEPVRAGDLIHTSAEVKEDYTKTNRSGKINRIIELLTTSTNQNDKLVCTATYRLVIRGE